MELNLDDGMSLGGAESCYESCYAVALPQITLCISGF